MSTTPITPEIRVFVSHLEEMVREAKEGKLIGAAVVWQFEDRTVVTETLGMIYNGYEIAGSCQALGNDLIAIERDLD